MFCVLCNWDILRNICIINKRFFIWVGVNVLIMNIKCNKYNFCVSMFNVCDKFLILKI